LNDRYRDTTRDFWKGAAGAGDIAQRLTASGDVFNRLGRRPWACVNFLTAHDGFTLNDLVSYNDRHNEANGEDNKDGSSDNRSWNCGMEGPSDDAAINTLRERQIRNFLATLLLSQGTPSFRKSPPCAIVIPSCAGTAFSRAPIMRSSRSGTSHGSMRQAPR
jgi:isoamylase